MGPEKTLLWPLSYGISAEGAFAALRENPMKLMLGCEKALFALRQK